MISRARTRAVVFAWPPLLRPPPPRCACASATCSSASSSSSSSSRCWTDSKYFFAQSVSRRSRLPLSSLRIRSSCTEGSEKPPSQSRSSPSSGVRGQPFRNQRLNSRRSSIDNSACCCGQPTYAKFFGISATMNPRSERLAHFATEIQSLDHSWFWSRTTAPSTTVPNNSPRAL